MEENTLVIDKARKIKLIVFDVDGVLTDGKLYLGENGNEYKAFNTRDGLGLVMLKNAGYHVAVITGRSSKIVSERMEALGINYLYQGQENKKEALMDILGKLGLSPEESAYLGDDLIDLPAMNRVGLSIAVNDAHPFVIKSAHAVTENRGGKGAAREVCEFILKAQGKLDDILQNFS